MPKLPEKILFVDDDPNILTGYKRQLRKTANIYTALGADEGLKLIAREGPFAVVISDMRMPKMNGAEFLTKVKEIAPNSVRIILTGQSDMESAIEAINQGQIFRFLTKPCPHESMAEALIKAIYQYRLANAEKELQEKTLLGVMRITSEALSMSNPYLYGQAISTAYYTHHMLLALELETVWDIEVAALLSGFGIAPLQGHITKQLTEQQIYDPVSLPNQESITIDTLRNRLSNIPRLNTITAILETQNTVFRLTKPVNELSNVQRIQIGGHLIKIAKHAHSLVRQGRTLEQAINEMAEKECDFDSILVNKLDYLHNNKYFTPTSVRISELTPGMLIDEDIRLKSGELIVPFGHEVTETLLTALQHNTDTENIRQPIRALQRITAAGVKR